MKYLYIISGQTDLLAYIGVGLGMRVKQLARTLSEFSFMSVGSIPAWLWSCISQGHPESQFFTVIYYGRHLRHVNMCTQDATAEIRVGITSKIFTLHENLTAIVC
jgi:hypothetical protein